MRTGVAKSDTGDFKRKIVRGLAFAKPTIVKNVSSERYFT
jgi:hypothetical protein